MFDVFVPILTLLTFELITSHHGQILGTKGIKIHKFQAGVFHLPSHQRHKKNTHTVDKERHSLEKQASRALRGIDNQVDPPLLHLTITQIQTTKWPAQNEIEKPKSVLRQP